MLFLEYTNRILDDCEIATNKMMKMRADGGKIDIGYVFPLAGSYMPHMVRLFLNEEDNGNIIFGFHQGDSNELINKVKSGELDIGFGGYARQDSELEFYPILRHQMVIITPKDHPLNDGPVSIRDIEKYPVIGYNRRSWLGRFTIDTYFNWKNYKEKGHYTMPNVTGHTELVGLMAYPIRHTQSPTTHNLAYDINGDDVIQMAFEVDNDSLEAAINSIRALRMLGSNISMPNKTVVHQYLEEVDEAAKLCGAINTVVNMRDEEGKVTGRLKGYNTDGMGYWQGVKEEGIDFKGMKMVLIGTGGAGTAIAVRGALDGISEMYVFNKKDKFYGRGEEIVATINDSTQCKAFMYDLDDLDLLKEKMMEADIFCDSTGVGMHPLENESVIPDPSYFKKDLIVTDTVYAPRETLMMKQAKEAGCEKVYNGMSMMLFQALIAIELYTGKSTPVDYMKEKLGI